MAGFESAFRPKGGPKMSERHEAEKETPDAETKVHELHEKSDGTFHTVTHDGEQADHPDHLHALAHLAHHVTGGEKHHITHHDGMEYHTHGVNEDGSHEDTEDHNTADEAKDAMDKFFGEEAEEPAHQHDGETEDESQPALGGM